MTSLYEDLGVPEDADAGAIKSAYRNKAKTEHPDTGGSADRFARIDTAYRVLSDPAKRARYDETGNVEDDDEDAMVRAAIDGIMAAVTETFKPEQDLIEAALGVVDAKLDEVRASKGKLIQKVDKLERAIGRIKKDTENVVSSIMAIRIKGLQQQISQFEQIERVVSRARETISKVEYRADEPFLKHDDDWLMKPSGSRRFSFFNGDVA